MTCPLQNRSRSCARIAAESGEAAWRGSGTRRSRSAARGGRRRSPWPRGRTWARAPGGLRVDQAKRLKELERENARLKRLVADQALDNAILKAVSSGNF